MSTTKRFGTFDGVFTPTFLSILGVIMYLRLGWVVGSVGLWGALGIIAIANVITLFTCLSISSITTNIRIGTGGAYSIIAKSLGLEAGGAIGIPLYLSQAISVAFYVVGFSECWTAIIPHHDIVYVTYGTWAVLLVIAYISAKFAFRVQFVIMALVFGSIISFMLGKTATADPSFLTTGEFTASFWHVFAVFFPAVTGILAGVSMSGELNEPKKSIPKGILSAVIISAVIYVAFALRFSYVADQAQLVGNTSIIIDLGRWKWLILAGIMGATLSSALSMTVTAPRTLLALAKHGLIPFSNKLSFVSKRGEPVNAVLLTAVISLSTLLVGTLNNIALLLTMFFLITYGMLNLTVFIEQFLGIISFRPVFKIHILVPLIGWIGCLGAMILIQPEVSFIAVFIIGVIYVVLLKRNVRKNWPDVRKGIFIFMAERAIKIANALPYHPKIWKPNILVPIGDPSRWKETMLFIKDITKPSGRIDVFSIMVDPKAPYRATVQDNHMICNTAVAMARKNELKILTRKMEKEGMLISAFAITANSFLQGATTLGETLKSSPFPPNLLFLKLGPTIEQDVTLKNIVECLGFNDMGVLLLSLHEKIKLGDQKIINLWIREGSPNINLAILIALKLEENWGAKLRLVQAAKGQQQIAEGEKYLKKVIRVFRLSKNTKYFIIDDNFNDAISLKKIPQADINLFGMPLEIDINSKRDLAQKMGTTVLFLRDSNQESAIV